MNLVLVESPAKSRTIQKILGHDYQVMASFGHVRDLPKSKLGIDVEHDFEPTYEVPLKAKKVVAELKALAKKAEVVLFASDADREGEAISWHIAHLLNVPDEKIKRITFHEITKSAITHALEHPRHLDMKLVDAQQARRILDRLVGYELSPFLWKKVARGLSAGRVQSVAQRLVVERERERRAFKTQDYWSLTAWLKDKPKHESFPAQLVRIDEQKPLTKFELATGEAVDALVTDLEGSAYTVATINQKSGTRKPLPPFTTSTLQQAANVRLGFSSKQTMMLAQQLYEGVELPDEGSIGLITYMRTDSLNLAEQFVQDARAVIAETYGAKAVNQNPRLYKTKSKGAQEAHEAIRPTDPRRSPAMLKNMIEPRLWRLYDLIWCRALASQMADAQVAQTSVDISAQGKKSSYTFRATGQEIKFAGWLAALPAGAKETILPPLKKGEVLALDTLKSEMHTTEPPARYSDATLVKVLEEHGIGRPSTYAPTISTIIERGYVERDEQKKLKPTAVGEVVTDALKEHFPDIVDYEFTATMENKLDRVAAGEEPWVPVIREFYEPFKANLDKKYKEVDKKDLTEAKSDEVCEKCGKPMIIKLGRFGKFLACTGYPECKTTKPLATEAGADGKPTIALPTIPPEQIPDCPAGHGKMEIKHGRYGVFFGCPKYPECKELKSIATSTGVTCPACGQGDIIEKRSKRGRIFYSCSTYPACTFALWNKPTGEKCPACSSLMVMMKSGPVCSHKECPGHNNTKTLQQKNTKTKKSAAKKENTED